MSRNKCPHKRRRAWRREARGARRERKEAAAHAEGEGEADHERLLNPSKRRNVVKPAGGIEGRKKQTSCLHLGNFKRKTLETVAVDVD